MFDDAWQTLVKIGAGLAVLALLLGMISGGMYISYKYNDKQNENQSMASAMSEQRKNTFYNNTHVYAQDVVAYVFRFKGERSVTVRLTTQAKTYTWSNTISDTAYTNSAISAVIPKNLIYDSILVYGPNGNEVIGVEFIECPSNTVPGADCSFPGGGP